MGTWTRDLHEERVQWSPELEDVFGIERGTFPGTEAAFHELIHPQDRDRLVAAVAQCLVDGEEYCVLFRYRHSTGGWRWMEGRGLPTFDEGGKPVRLDGVGIDVTDRTLAENVKFRLAAIVESSDDAILSKTLEGIITSWNAGASRLFGYTAEEMIGTPITRLIPRDLLPEEKVILQKIRSGERVDHYETHRLAKDGSIVDVSLTVSPVRDITGSIIGASKIARDVGALRRASAERDALLESERAARAEAERLGHLKDEFLATLSHELRTPLTAILGWSNMLLRRSTLRGPELEAALETINRNARAQARIIDDLLDMNRMVMGKIRLEIDSVELGDLVRTAIEAIRPSAAAKQLHLKSLIDPAAGVVTGDGARLQQVLWNLLTNAVKFTPAQGFVHVTLRRADPHVEIVVEDSGIGVDPEFLPLMFDRFRQADGSTTRQHGGLGLGLSIVRNLVELHGGTITARSPGPNRGTTLVVRLPALPAYGVFTGTEGPGISPKQSEQVLQRLDGILVLSVDDEPDGRALLARLLEDTGAQVVSAGSAEEAMRVVTQRPVDVVVSDIGMPGLDGYAFIRHLRALKSPAGNLPAIALTAYARTEDRDRSLAAGYQLHITKPFSFADLAAGIARLVPR